MYLEGSGEEYRPGQDVFAAIGRRCSGLIDSLIPVEDEQIDIRLEGPARAARYLAGAVIAPFSDRDVVGETQASRAQRLVQEIVQTPRQTK